MPQERNVLTERFWTVRVIRDFWYKGVWRQVGEQIHMPPHVARGQIEAGNVLQVNWPKATTDIPWALQSVGPQAGGSGVAGVGSINGIDGDINILAGPNITVTTGASSITIGAPNVVPTSRQIIAGAGLSGGGALTGNVTLTANVQSVFGRTGAITAQVADYVAGQITISPAIGTSGWTNVHTALTSIYNDIQSGALGGPWALGTGGAIYYNGGNVGIGTATPTAPLEVVGTNVISHGDIADVGPVIFTAKEDWAYVTLDTNSSAGPYPYPGGGILWLNRGSYLGEIDCWTNGVGGAPVMSFFVGDFHLPNERMRITHDGKVGINSKGVDPQFTLDVAGDINIADPGGANGYAYRVNGVPITGGGAAVHVGPTAPASPPIGQLWWDTTNIRLMIWNGAWIQAA